MREKISFLSVIIARKIFTRGFIPLVGKGKEPIVILLVAVDPLPAVMTKLREKDPLCVAAHTVAGQMHAGLIDKGGVAAEGNHSDQGRHPFIPVPQKPVFFTKKDSKSILENLDFLQYNVKKSHRSKRK